jgi:HTH-type transcriptional regulator, sugar sensing transcriptional regulator
MNNQEKILEEIGFSKKKAKIYLAILELGDASAINIAKEVGIKRTTVYNILPELISDGFVKKTIKNKKSIFFVENPDLLKTHLEEKLELIEKNLPGFRSLQNIFPFKPKITFYEGFGGIKELYKDTLDSSKSGDAILSLTGITDYQRLMPQDISREYIENRIKKKIRIKVIATDSEVAQKWKESSIRELREIRIIKEADFKFDGDMEIYGNKVALISYRENFMSVVIESKEITQMQRMAFKLMWNSIE